MGAFPGTEVSIPSMLQDSACDTAVGIEDMMRMRKASVERHDAIESKECMENALHPLEVDVGLVLPLRQNNRDAEVWDPDTQDSHPDDHLALPSSVSKWLFRVSWLSSTTFLLAVYMHLFDLAIVPAAVLFTSINYWRRPDYSWRRYVDIITVQLTIYYQVVRAVDAPEPYRTAFYCTLAFACSNFLPAMIYVVRPPDGKWRKFPSGCGML